MTAIDRLPSQALSNSEPAKGNANNAETSSNEMERPTLQWYRM
jgi:hypothetical protein